jgi:F0F1-type ATP synthase assembly protein I
MVRYARGFAIAFEFTGMIAGGAILGWWLDRMLGTGPYLGLIVTLFGVAGGFLRLVQMIQRFRDLDERSQR